MEGSRGPNVDCESRRTPQVMSTKDRTSPTQTLALAVDVSGHVRAIMATSQVGQVADQSRAARKAVGFSTTVAMP